MKIIIGLGNQGKQYLNTRHNIGFRIIESIHSNYYRESDWQVEKKFSAVVCRPVDKNIILVKPTTMMNNSGLAVSKVVNYHKIKMAQLWVIVDDLDIKIGEYKIQLGRGPKDHNGLNSIYEKLGSRSFWHVRVGIDNRGQLTEKKIFGFKLPFKARRLTGEEYVLQKFDQTELELMEKTIDNVCKDLVNSFD